jgi:predicted transcriptional regulator
MQNEESINKRIQSIMNYYGLNINSFSKRIGFDNNTIIGKIINMPDRKPSYDTLVCIIEHFPKISCRWLLTGKGGMFIEPDNSFMDAKDRVRYLMDSLNLGVNELSLKSNIQAEEITSVLNGSIEPTIKMFDGILSGCPEISPDWLYRNVGGMKINEEKGV